MISGLRYFPVPSMSRERKLRPRDRQPRRAGAVRWESVISHDGSYPVLILINRAVCGTCPEMPVSPFKGQALHILRPPLLLLDQ